MRPIGLITTLLALLVFLTACSDKDEPAQTIDNSTVAGTWTGTYSYYNPAGGTKYQYLTVILDEDGSGELEYETPSSFSKAIFSYKVSDRTVICEGVWASTFGDIDTEFYLTLKISGQSLLPQEKYDMFVLYRNGYDTPEIPDGGEDHAQALKKTWVEDDGSAVINITSDLVETYIVNENRQYVYYSCDDFSYWLEKQTIVIDGNNWFIKECTGSRLVIESGGTVRTLYAGNSSDIPRQPCLHEFLPYAGQFNSADNGCRYDLVFEKGNVVYYYETIDVYADFWGDGTSRRAELSAKGTWEYGFSDNQILCYFKSPSWWGGDKKEFRNLFEGWEYEKPCFKYFTIDAISPREFKVTLPNGKTVIMKPYSL